MKNIFLIGVGNIGFRHLQSLNKIGCSININVIDPNRKSLNVAKDFFHSGQKNNYIQSVNYYEKIEKTNKIVDLAIIATNADVRRSVLEKMINTCKVRFIILEKIAFQNSEDFSFIINLLKDKGIKAWVNCSRRAYLSYQKIQSKINKKEIVNFSVIGGGWGIGCNSIHMIDLFSFMNSCSDLSIDASDLDKNIIKSKRSSFVEFSGVLKGRLSNGSQIIMVDNKSFTNPITIIISTKSYRYIILESSNLILESSIENNFKWDQKEFSTELISDLTYQIVEKLFDSSKCDLTTLEESYSLHKPLINGFITHLNHITGKEYSRCPIT